MAENEPLRHGWGGDPKKREIALLYKKAEQEERPLYPHKFGEDTPGVLTDEDLKLLEVFLSQPAT